MLELRTGPQGHPEYRAVCQQMHRLIAEQAGHHAHRRGHALRRPRHLRPRAPRGRAPQRSPPSCQANRALEARFTWQFGWGCDAWGCCDWCGCVPSTSTRGAGGQPNPMRLIRLLLAAGAPRSARPTPALPAYTVKRGDTLGRIAAQLGVPVKDLADANGIKNADLILERTGPAATGRQDGAADQRVGPRRHAPARRRPRREPGEHRGAVRNDRHANWSRSTASATRTSSRSARRSSFPAGSGIARCVVTTRSCRTGRRRDRATRATQGNDIFAKRGASVVTPVSGVLRQVQGKIAGNAFYLAGDDGHTYYFAHLDRYSRGARSGRRQRGDRHRRQHGRRARDAAASALRDPPQQRRAGRSVPHSPQVVLSAVTQENFCVTVTCGDARSACSQTRPTA